MKENRKIYDRTFKENAVMLSYESESINKLERELKLYHGSIARWRKDYEKFGKASFPGRGHQKFSLEQERIYWLEKKIKHFNLKFEILKNSKWHISQGRPMMYRFIQNNEKIYPIREMCKVLNIKDITYYRWRSQAISETKKKKILVLEEISSIFYEAQQRYGSARILIELQNRGYKLSRSSVSIYMKELGLYCNRKKYY